MLFRSVVCASVIPDKIIRGNPDLSTNSMIHSDKKIGSAESSEMASSHASIGHGLEDISWNHSGTSNTRGISLSALSRSVPQPAIIEESAKAKGTLFFLFNITSIVHFHTSLELASVHVAQKLLMFIEAISRIYRVHVKSHEVLTS